MVTGKSKIPLRRGFFITFEGIDGSGKSVQARSLSSLLDRKGYPVLHVRDPGGPPISEAIRNILLDSGNGEMSPVTELFLYEASRAQLVDQWIRPALEKNRIVISDRFYDSTTVYQGYGRNIPLDRIHELNRAACGGIKPDRSYVLVLPWKESLRRRSGGMRKTDRMESDVAHFYRAVTIGYEELSKQEPERVRLLDGTRTIESLELEIHQDVLNMIRQP
jgi:dTMP kinase